MIDLAEVEALAKSGLEYLDEKLLTIDSALKGLPHVELSDSVAYYLRDGQAVIVPHAPTKGLVRVYDNHHVFLGLGKILDDGRVAPNRLVSV